MCRRRFARWFCAHATKDKRHHAYGIIVGGVIMLLGAAISTHADDILSVLPLNHTLVDAGGYFLHGFGAMPFYTHLGRLWEVWSA